MIPKRVTLKNFLSFGDEEQTFDFTEPDESLWILTGPNGVGKSAVFDAITYCLFTEHRGGGQDAKSLIKHGANGFHISFEFEFSGENYRIFRGRPASNAQPSQRVERVDPASGEWKAIPGLNSTSDVKNWVRDSLGLRFETFASSVLLRQGQSDVIVEATGKERLEVLKRIIDVERFEALSARIAEVTKEHGDGLKKLTQQRDTKVSATEAEVEAARAALDVAESAREKSLQAKLAALQGVEQAKQFVKLDGERVVLDRQLREADERAKQSDQIKKSHAKYVELQAVVPPLRTIAASQTQIDEAELKQRKNAAALEASNLEQATTSTALEKARTDEAAHSKAKTEHDNEARQLGKEVDDESKFLTTAKQVAELEKKLADYAPDLDAKLRAAEERERTTGGAVATASNRASATATRLERTLEDQKEFEKAGPTCSRCRQPVTEKHAAEERAKLERDIADLTKERDAAALSHATAQREKLAATAEAETLKDDVQKRKSTRDALSLHRQTLDTFGIVADPAALQQQLDAKQTEKSQHERQAIAEAALAKTANGDVTRLDVKSKKLTQERVVIDGESRTLDTTLATHRAARDALITTLPNAWQVRATTITGDELTSLESRLAALEGDSIARQFAALQSDSDSQIRWKAQRESVIQELAGLPSGTVAEAEALVDAATTAAREAESARDAANGEVERLKREADSFKLLLQEITAAETIFGRHQKLNVWLGKDGLLRELVREAERDIVRHAQATLNNLSGGDLEITLQGESDGKDEALKLLVRRQGSDSPIPVKYLSGSQKFRVAVAIAVAIGKFASGTSAARPLESVIIDEGFGSLDKDGLNSMREELENLKNSGTLKRIILVSHQEEFTSSFPVGYRLEPGENGTIATRFQAG